MYTLKEINSLRKWFTHLLTAGIGNPSSKNTILPDQAKVKSILVTRPNHRLGNLLLITPLLQEIEHIFPNAKIDLFLKGGLGPIISKEYRNVDQIIALPKEHFKQLPNYMSTWFKLRKKKYDLVINAVPDSSSGRLSTKLSRAKYKLYGESTPPIETLPEDWEHIAKLPVCYLRNAKAGIPSGPIFEIPSLDLKISSKEIEKGKEVLENITGHHPRVLAIFTYATGEKCHPKTWWQEFYKMLKVKFPDYFILEILPKEKVSQIDFEAPVYYSKDLREICSVLANTKAFVGADSGMMHLAVASKTPVIGLFNVTDSKKYRPYGEKNQAVNTIQTSIEAIMDILNTTLTDT